MGQFKPMVKMMTTEPSVELKLAKGGAVKMKKGGSTTKAKKMAMGGGALNALAGTPALIGRPAVNAPVRAPGKPSMAARRQAMMAKPAMPATMKKGGKAEKHEDAAQDRAMIKKALAGKKFASGGEIDSFETKTTVEGNEGKYKTTLVHGTPKGRTSGATGDVKNGNAGGFKKGGKAKKFATGGVALSNAGGFKKGGYATGGNIPEEESYGSYDKTLVHQANKRNPSVGTGGVKDSNAGGYKSGGKASKKAFATGGEVKSGAPVAMPQGRKPVPSPVAISRLAGTYKSGGRATPAEARLLKNSAAENATAMRQAKKDSNLKYGSSKRMAGGGQVTDYERKQLEDLSKGAYDKTGKYNRELEDALNPLSMAKELYGKAKDFLMPKGSDSVTKTRESVTVAPAKKRGGRC